MSPVAHVSILVLGEDTASDAHATLVALAKKALTFLEPGCEMRRVRFEPPQEGPVRQALRANLWESTRPQDQEQKRALIAYIATKLLDGSTSFVLFHMDADHAWRQRPKPPKELDRLTKFRKFIERDVQQFIEHRSRQQGSRSGRQVSLAQLLMMIPYYSIESWLFQNTLMAVQLCKDNPTCRGRHLELLETWQADRMLLDELVKPKMTLCFGAEHNLILAKDAGFPTAEVEAAQKSFAAMLQVWRGSPSLSGALREIRAGSISED